MPTRIMDTVCNILACVSGMFLAALMIVTMIDVCGRYFFNAPLYGSYEITQLLLAAMIFLALPATTRRRENITVELFPMFRRGLGVLQAWGIALLCGGILEVLAWRLYLIGQSMARYGELSADLSFPLATIAYLMCVTTAFSGLIMFAMPWLPATSDDAPAKENSHE